MTLRRRGSNAGWILDVVICKKNKYLVDFSCKKLLIGIELK